MATTEIDSILKSQVDNNKSPSVQYVIFDTDRVIHKFEYGFAKIGDHIPTAYNTTYGGFSITKTVTALAILQLAEKGKLNIDDVASNYLYDFPYSSNITIRQVLSHTAGIPNPLPLRWVHLPEESESFDRNSFFKQIFIKNGKTKSNPNEKFAYSNIGYILLGQIIEEVSGLRYEDYIYKNILEPIDITKGELDFVINDTDLHATGYQKSFSLMNLILGFMMDKSKFMGGTEGKWKLFKDMYVNGAPHGGLIGTPIGFMKYIQELLKKENRLSLDNNMQMLFTENLTNSNKKTGMCLSWFKGKLNGHEYFTHAGGGGGYYCEIRIYPSTSIGSVIMFNRTGVKDERFLDKVDKFVIK